MITCLAPKQQKTALSFLFHTSVRVFGSRQGQYPFFAPFSVFYRKYGLKKRKQTEVLSKGHTSTNNLTLKLYPLRRGFGKGFVKRFSKNIITTGSAGGFTLALQGPFTC